MRIIVFFDLPVTTATERGRATRFRNFLLKDGYTMLQFSVYCRVCNGMDAVNKHKQRVEEEIPPEGSVRMLVITEKQYESMDIMLGNLTEADMPFQAEQFTTF